MTESNSIPTRDQVDDRYQWDLTKIYNSDKEWENELPALEVIESEISALKGKLSDGPHLVANAFELQCKLFRSLEKLYIYAHLKSDQDLNNSTYMGMQDRIQMISTRAQAAISWMDPEILSLGDDKIVEIKNSEKMKPFLRSFEELIRFRPHTLTEKEERLLSLAAEPLGLAVKTFSVLNNADLEFPTIEDSEGKPTKISHANYSLLLESKDRDLRSKAFNGLFSTYQRFKNTFASTLSGQVKKHAFNAKIRNYPSALEASLFQDAVDPTVYENLINCVHEALPTFHKYLNHRKKVLGLDKLDMYDLHVSLLPDYDVKIGYDEACDLVVNSVAPLGKDYQEKLKTSFSDGWIDVYENKGKRSGAYSSGGYDTNPYILLNFSGNLNSVFTLAHELGHSLHSYYSREYQPYHYSRYKIFVAEVASTTNEMLLHHHILNTSTDENLKTALANHLCDSFKGTMVRQTMFGEFEKMIHEYAESGKALTPDLLEASYCDLNKKYHGDAVEADPLIGMEWARIPHFYYNFYVYKYATGFAAAQFFSQMILAGDKAGIESYLKFLKSGGSKDPLDLLEEAGLDLRDPAPIRKSLQGFDQSVNELITRLN